MKKKLLFLSLFFVSLFKSQVGINTGTPQKNLHVNGSLQVVNELNVGGNSTTAGSAGSTGQVLTSQGPNQAPVWSTINFPVANQYNLKRIYKMDIGKGTISTPQTGLSLAVLNNIQVDTADNFIYVTTQNSTYLAANTATGVSYRFDFLLDNTLTESTAWQTIARQGFSDAALNNPYQFLISNVTPGVHNLTIRGFRQNNTDSSVTTNLYFNQIDTALTLKKGFVIVFVYEK